MYDKVKIIFEKDGEPVVRGEVLARENADLTAEYLIQNFWTMHKAVERKEADLEVGIAEVEHDQTAGYAQEN